MAALTNNFHGIDLSNEILNSLDKDKRKLVKSYELSYNKETSVTKHTVVFKNGEKEVKVISDSEVLEELGIDKNDIEFNDFFHYNYLVLTRIIKEH